MRSLAPILSSSLALIGCGADGGTESAVPTCELHEDALDKRFFSGEDLTSDHDNPPFELEATILEASFEPSPNVPELSGRTWPVTRFEITEDYLIVRRAEEDDGSKGPIGAVFSILGHGVTPCESGFGEDPSGFIEETTTPQSSAIEETGLPQHPWYARPWMRVDWSQELLLEGFDAATDAGYPDAVVIDPLAAAPRGQVLALDQGYLATEVRAFVSWQTAEDGTPGCAFDVPDFDPAAGCPNGELVIRYELRALTDPSP